MIEIEPHRLMVESVSDLPNYMDADTVFCDVETNRNWDHKKEGGMYPFGPDEICGLAITVDEDPNSYYLPVRHKDDNMSLNAARKWMLWVMGSCRQWVNHNVNFDAQFLVKEGISPPARLVDTMSLSKITDSDRMTHGLKPLVRDILGDSYEEEDEIKNYLKGIGSKSYGDVPADILGRYACKDVLVNRQLYRHFMEGLPEQSLQVLEMEIALAPVLYDMELRGMMVDKKTLKIELLKSLHIMLKSTERISEITGFEFTNSSTNMYDILCNQYGLPVLAYTDTGGPSFDADTLKLYEAHPEVIHNKDLSQVMDLIVAYRTESQFKGLFVEPYLEFSQFDGRIHPSYNPIVRTGRMSCRRPNGQQLNKRAKMLVLPDDCFASWDYSQIEFRLICHYIKDEEAIRAYNENPDTDFHQWVSDMLSNALNARYSRKPAKTVNFAIGYGAGKRKVCSELAGNKEVVEMVTREIDDLIEQGILDPTDRKAIFTGHLDEKAETIYNTYHERLPGIKPTSRKAAAICRRRGYVFNAYGRRRNLPDQMSHKAFNTVVQGTAMDIMKEKMIELSPRNNKWIRDLGISLAANVHDEVLMDGPEEVFRDEKIQQRIREVMETPTIDFRVPIRTGLGISSENWAIAAGDEGVIF